MKWLLLFLAVLLTGLDTYAQNIILQGKVYDETDNSPLPGVWISLTAGNTVISRYATDSAGHFLLAAAKNSYVLHADLPGFIPFRDTFVLQEHTGTRKIYLQPRSNILNEVRIIEKVNAVVQKDDTTEYDARAFKVHHDAAAYDLVRKMPGMKFSGKNLESRGAAVTRLLIDGKPFLSDDPYAALKNFPAYVIKSVQVYQESGEQEQFTGFKEGTENTTINIITQPDKKNGRFGKITGGLGNNDVYAGSANMNFFNKKSRLSLIGQSSNNSTQNLADATNYESAHGSGGSGIFNLSNLMINYSGQWNSGTQVSGDLTGSRTNNRLQHELWRQYILKADSGRLYHEHSLSENKNYNTRLNVKINHTIDSFNAVVLQSAFSFLDTKSTALLSAITTVDDMPVNRISNQTGLSGTTGSMVHNILFKHKFRKPGRTFSLNLNTGFRKNDQVNLQATQNQGLDTIRATDIVERQSPSLQSGSDISANAAYTETWSSRSTLQWQYKVTYDESSTQKYAYDITMQPPVADSQLSSVFTNKSIKHKTGADYQYHSGRLRITAGIYGQSSYFSNTISFPAATTFSYHFQNVLPAATFQYKLAAASNLQASYNTAATTPSAAQLQSSINNANPLYLQSGNPDLRQTYRHVLNLRYLFTNTTTASNLSIRATAAITRHSIGNEVIIAANDTLIGNLKLYKGGQFIRPVNLEGYRSINAGASYTWAVKALKSNLTLDLNGSVLRVPALINNRINYSQRRSLAIGINFNSNISEHIDYTFTSNSSYGYSVNTLNTTYNNSYFNQDAAVVFTITLLRSYILSADLYYQYNSGIPVAGGRRYVLANISIARKLFKGNQGCIRLSCYDILNQNKNVQYIITDTYTSSERTAALQRYATLSFTWSFNQFSAGKPASE